MARLIAAILEAIIAVAAAVVILLRSVFPPQFRRKMQEARAERDVAKPRDTANQPVRSETNPDALPGRLPVLRSLVACLAPVKWPSLLLLLSAVLAGYLCFAYTQKVIRGIWWFAVSAPDREAEFI